MQMSLTMFAIFCKVPPNAAPLQRITISFNAGFTARDVTDAGTEMDAASGTLIHGFLRCNRCN